MSDKRVKITDPPPVQLHEQWSCPEHGPTVTVLWTSGMRCPLCESYENERVATSRLDAANKRIAEALNMAANRWGEWGDRAVEVAKILEAREAEEGK